MLDSYFALSHETSHTGAYLGGPPTGGPWASELQHGGPPNALAVACAERAVAAETGRDDWVGRRLAADFLGAVPVGAVGTSARVLRAARTAALVEVTVAAGGHVALLARVWFVRSLDTTAVGAGPGAEVPVPTGLPGIDSDFPYARSIEWRFARGNLREPGPGAVWARPRLALLPGYAYSGLARAALLADSASGISAVLDWSAWSFVNVDLDVHLARPPIGEWLYLDAATDVGPDGAAVARSTISDPGGVVGAGLQTLVLAPSLPRG